MGIPRYSNFAKDFTAMWKKYSEMDPFEGIAPEEMPELREKWNLLKADGDALAEALNGRGGADGIWDEQFSYTLNQLLKLDTYRNAGTEDYDAEDLTQALNKRKESAIMWKLSQIGRNIYEQTEMMRLDSDHHENKLESTKLQIKCAHDAQDFQNPDDKFALYGDNDALERAVSESAEELKKAQDEVESVKKEFHVDETMLEPAYVLKLKSEWKQQLAESERLTQEYKRIGEEIKKQESAVAELTDDLAKLQQQYAEEPAKKEQLGKEAEEIRRTIETEETELYQQGDAMKVAEAVKTFSDTQATEAENFFSTLRTEIENRPSWAVLSDTREEKNYQDKRAAFLEAIERYEDSARAYNTMESDYGSFLKQEKNADFAKKLMEDGKRLSALSADEQRSLTPDQKYALEVYLAAEEHKEQLREGFKAHKPDKKFWEEFDEKTATFAGIMAMSDRLCAMNKTAIGDQYIQPKPGKELTEFEKRCNTGMAEIEKNYNLLKVFRRQQADNQRKLGTNEKEFAAANKRLSELRDELKRKEAALSDDTLAQSVARKEKALEEAKQTLAKSVETQRSTLAAQKAAEEKAAQMHLQAENMAKLKKALQNTEKAQAKQTELAALKGTVDKLYEATCDTNQRVQKLTEYYGFTAEELSNPPKDRRAVNDLTLMPTVREKLLNGLKHFAATESVGMEQGHKNSDEYKAMINALNALTENDGAALKDKSPDEVRELLSTVGKGAADYITAKNDQYFQVFRHSNMRKTRLDFAKELQEFCKTGAEMVERAKFDKYDMLVLCWDKEMRQRALHALNDGTLKEGQSAEDKKKETKNALVKSMNKAVKTRLTEKEEKSAHKELGKGGAEQSLGMKK